MHGLRTTSRTFGVVSAKLSAVSTLFGTVSPLSIFSIIQSLFQKQKKSLYPNLKYLFGIRIRILAEKNQGFSLQVSVVRATYHAFENRSEDILLPNDMI